VFLNKNHSSKIIKGYLKNLQILNDWTMGSNNFTETKSGFSTSITKRFKINGRLK